MFEFVEGLLEDLQKPNESPSLNKAFLLTRTLNPTATTADRLWETFVFFWKGKKNFFFFLN